MPGAQCVLSEREQSSSRGGSYEGKRALTCSHGLGSSVGVSPLVPRSLRWRFVPAAFAETEKDSGSLLSLTGSGLSAATMEGCGVLFPILLESDGGGDRAPGCGPPGPSLELPAHRPLAIVCRALVWLRAGGQGRDCGNGLEALFCFPSV